MGELKTISMSVKRDSSNGKAANAPYYNTKIRSIDSKIVQDLLDKVISDPSLEHVICYNGKRKCYYGTLKTDQYAILKRLWCLEVLNNSGCAIWILMNSPSMR